MDENRIIGCVSWFDSKKGYGFVKVLTPDHKKNGSDIFIHFSNIQVNDNEYKVVYPGEYIEFDLSESNDDRPCCLNVTGLYGGNLLTQNENHRYKILRKRVREETPIENTDDVDAGDADAEDADAEDAGAEDAGAEDAGAEDADDEKDC